jgi:hypothetical protein
VGFVFRLGFLVAIHESGCIIAYEADVRKVDCGKPGV